MQTLFDLQNEFMEAGELPKHTKEAEQLAISLIEEEYEELLDSRPFLLDNATRQSQAHTVKENIDLIYVACQRLNAIIGPEKAMQAFEAVHEHNMIKVCGDVKKRDDGKVLKPANLPDIEHVLEAIIG